MTPLLHICVQVTHELCPNYCSIHVGWRNMYIHLKHIITLGSQGLRFSLFWRWQTFWTKNTIKLIYISIFLLFYLCYRSIHTQPIQMKILLLHSAQREVLTVLSRRLTEYCRLQEAVRPPSHNSRQRAHKELAKSVTTRNVQTLDEEGELILTYIRRRG